MGATAHLDGLLESRDELTGDEVELLIQSMEFTRQTFEDCAYYPSLEFRRKRIGEADRVLTKLRKIRQGVQSTPLLGDP